MLKKFKNFVTAISLVFSFSGCVVSTEDICLTSPASCPPNSSRGVTTVYRNAALMSADPATFQLVRVGSTETLTLTIKNVGQKSGTLGTLSSASLGLTAPFSLVGGSCSSGQVLASQETCTITLLFNPSSASSVSQTLSLPYDDGNQPTQFQTIVSAEASAPDYAVIRLTSNQSAGVVIGQPDFTTVQWNGPTNQDLYEPWGNPTIYNGKLFIVDWDDNRIVGFNSIPTLSYPAADFVLGQTDFTSYVSAATINNFAKPWSSSALDNVFAVADHDNSRVLLFSPVPSITHASATHVLGQPNFTSSGDQGCTSKGMYYNTSVSLGGGKLAVSDGGHNRVLIFNSVPSSDYVDADLVLGQADFTHCAINQGGVSAESMQAPGDVWTDGNKLIVADSGNHRILVWKSFPTTNGQPADLVLGQMDFYSNLPNQGGSVSASSVDSSTNFWSNVTSNGGQIFYSDYNNNRILIWNSFPSINGASADVVLGQPNFITNTALNPPTASSLNGVGGITYYGTQFFITDYGNNRVLIFDGS